MPESLTRLQTAQAHFMHAFFFCHETVLWDSAQGPADSGYGSVTRQCHPAYGSI